MDVAAAASLLVGALLAVLTSFVTSKITLRDRIASERAIRLGETKLQAYTDVLVQCNRSLSAYSTSALRVGEGREGDFSEAVALRPELHAVIERAMLVASPEVGVEIQALFLQVQRRPWGVDAASARGPGRSSADVDDRSATYRDVRQRLVAAIKRELAVEV